MNCPDFSFENMHDGPVCGLDEVGRGPLAGPVVASCVHIPPEYYTLDFIPRIKDSKTLSAKALGELYALITQHFIYGIGEVSPQEIDEINILQASLKAMNLALIAADHPFAHALVDGNRVPPALPCPATPIIKGDSKSISIAAASILAKVTRDRMMHALHEIHPHYGWDSNVGYPTKAHLRGMETHGITDHHRRSFAPVQRILESKIR